MNICKQIVTYYYFFTCCSHSRKITLMKIYFYRFLLQCLEDLDKNLRALNSRLFVIRGQPADCLPKLFKEWNTNCLTFEEVNFKILTLSSH